MEDMTDIYTPTIQWIEAMIIKPQFRVYGASVHNDSFIINMNGFNKNIKFPSGNIICDGCLQGKTNNKISETRASYPLELIHADLMEMPITLYYKLSTLS